MAACEGQNYHNIFCSRVMIPFVSLLQQNIHTQHPSTNQPTQQQSTNIIKTTNLYTAHYPPSHPHTYKQRGSQINITKRPSSRIRQLANRLRRSQHVGQIDGIIQRHIRRLNPKARHDGRAVNDKRPLRRLLVLPRPERAVDGCVVEEEGGVAGGDGEVL